MTINLTNLASHLNQPLIFVQHHHKWVAYIDKANIDNAPCAAEGQTIFEAAANLSKFLSKKNITTPKSSVHIKTEVVTTEGIFKYKFVLFEDKTLLGCFDTDAEAKARIHNGEWAPVKVDGKIRYLSCKQFSIYRISL